MLARPGKHHAQLASPAPLPLEPLPAKTESGKQACPFFSPVLGLGLASLSPFLLPPEDDPRYSEHGKAAGGACV